MEQSIKDLAWKCVQNNLRFEYIPTSTGLIVSDRHYNRIASIWLDDEQPEKELSWLQHEVDRHINEQQKMTS